MKKLVLSTIAGTLLATSVFAQSAIKKDIFQYFAQLPNTPLSLQDAYQNCKCIKFAGTSTDSIAGPTDSIVAPVQDAIAGDMQSASALTNTQAQQSQAGMASANQMQAGNVDSGTQGQKLSFVQNNMQGNTSGQAGLAQKMNDPAEKAKLMAMTPAQQMAYVQQMGAISSSPPASAAASANNSSHSGVADAVNKQKIMITQTSGSKALGLYQTLDSELQNANTPHGQIQQKMISDLSAGLNISGFNAKATKAKYMQQQSSLAAQQLQAMNKAYNAIFAFLKTSDSAYCAAMVAANYGYMGGSGQDNAVATLHDGQTTVFTHIGQLEKYLKAIYKFAAGWQLTKQQFDAGKI